MNEKAPTTASAPEKTPVTLETLTAENLSDFTPSNAEEEQAAENLANSLKIVDKRKFDRSELLTPEETEESPLTAEFTDEQEAILARLDASLNAPVVATTETTTPSAEEPVKALPKAALPSPATVANVINKRKVMDEDSSKRDASLQEAAKTPVKPATERVSAAKAASNFEADSLPLALELKETEVEPAVPFNVLFKNAIDRVSAFIERSREKYATYKMDQLHEQAIAQSKAMDEEAKDPTPEKSEEELTAEREARQEAAREKARVFLKRTGEIAVSAVSAGILGYEKVKAALSPEEKAKIEKESKLSAAALRVKKAGTKALNVANRTIAAGAAAGYGASTAAKSSWNTQKDLDKIAA